MKERLHGGDWRFLAVCVVLLVGASWYSVRNFYQAFPEASIDFRVSRTEARNLALRFLADKGYRTAGYREASSFTYDDDAKTFLEREAGLEQANRIMGKRVRLWRWSYRWFRPLQKEEYRVDITPAGEFVGFTHDIAEDAPRGELTAEAARAAADDFLRARLRRDPASLDFQDVSTVEKPHRVDRVFKWKERDFNLHEATNRVEVTVLGNEVAGYREYLKIPEQWTLDYEHLRSKNGLAEHIDSLLMLILAAGLVVIVVMRVRRQDVRWRRAALVGLAGMALSFCASLNSFPLSEFGYPTTDSYSSFLMTQLLQAVLSALGAGGLLFVLTAGAETLYREALPDKISLGSLFSLRGLRTKRFFLGATLGITLTAIFIAYQTVFYIVAYRYGAWSPADVPYDDLLNTRFPWLFVLFGGYFPAISEEFLFRMFGITFLRKVVRSTGVAVVLAAFIWGFGHSNYPQQPFFIRGLEVGIGGVVLGLVMLRWGILPTLVWHYSVDAMYSAMLLMRSHSLYFKLSGAASAGIVVLPVVLALAAYWRRGGFEPETGLLNRDEPPPAEPAPATPTQEAAEIGGPAYRRLTWRVRAIAVAVLCAGLLALLIPVSRFGESPRYKLTAAQARTSSDAFLRSQGLDPGTFRQVTYPATHWEDEDALTRDYFLERRPVSAASNLFERFRPVRHWATRYFRSLDVEGVTVSVHPETGAVLGFDHTVKEDQPGADLPPEAARGIAAAFAAAHGRDLTGMEPKESDSEKKKARRDYTLVWEARAGDPRNVDEAHYRVAVEVDGDRVVSLRSYWKLPESFERLRSQQNFLSIALMALRSSVLVAAIVFALWMLIRNTRLGLVPWRAAIRLAAAPALLTVVGPLLAMQLALRDYDTAVPFETFQVMQYTSLLISALAMFVVLAGAAALLTSFFPESLTLGSAANRRFRGVDALAALLAALGLGLLSTRLGESLVERFHGSALLSMGSPDLIASAAPALAALAGSVQTVLLMGAMLGLGALILDRLRKLWMRVLCVLLALVAILPGVHSAGEFALSYAMTLLLAVCVAVLYKWFARNNYLAWALVLWVVALRSAIAELLGNPNPALHLQGWILVGALAASVAWVAAPVRPGT